MWRAVLALSVVFCIVATGTDAGETGYDRDDLRTDFAVAKASGLIRSAAAVERFYAARNYHRAWDGRDGADLKQLRAAIGKVGAQGLTPSDYHLAAIGEAVASGQMALADILATDAYLLLARHLRDGRLDPRTDQPIWTVGRDAGALIHHLTTALQEGRIGDSLAALAPHLAAYRNLQRALRSYREAASAGGWPDIPAGGLLKLGARGPRVADLRARLEFAHLLQQAPGRPDNLFDAATRDAVKAFQRRAGLEPDGIVGPMTLRQLNITLDERVGQIKANLERLRWLPEKLGIRHIRVNIADYRLEAWENGRIAQTHDVIIGRTYRRTPVFSAKISYLIFNPWWFTPASIARNDELRHFQTDPGIIQRLGFEITNRAGVRLDPATIDWHAYSRRNFPFRVRQRPGPKNALGRVKLMFPNPYNVYLHDTPAQELFRRVQRDFSSGCVRVSDALGLATWALAGQPGWDRARIDAVVASGRETRVNLLRKIPVHVLYLTVVGDGDGHFRFVNDIYEKDPDVIAGLEQPPPRR